MPVEKRDGKEEQLDCMECERGTWMEFIETTSKKHDIWRCPECGLIHDFDEDGEVHTRQDE